MLDRIDREFGFQQDALSLLNKRQTILAANIANADTPGYLARDIDFSSQLKQAVSRQNGLQPLALTRTSGQHLAARSQGMDDARLLYRIPDQPSADGNTVDMDRERADFLDNSVKYESGLTVLSTQIKNMMSAISQG